MTGSVAGTVMTDWGCRYIPPNVSGSSEVQLGLVDMCLMFCPEQMSNMQVQCGHVSSQWGRESVFYYQGTKFFFFSNFKLGMMVCTVMPALGS